MTKDTRLIECPYPNVSGLTLFGYSIANWNEQTAAHFQKLGMPMEAEIFHDAALEMLDLAQTQRREEARAKASHFVEWGIGL